MVLPMFFEGETEEEGGERGRGLVIPEKIFQKTSPKNDTKV
jgi:hypothetical protein